MEIFSTKKRRVDHTHMHSEQGECTENLGKGYKSNRLAKCQCICCNQSSKTVLINR
jgi:hypothetical protein